MWPRSRALRSSKRVRRTTTSRRCCRKYSRNCLRLSRRGWPSTSATMFMPKLSCSCVSLYRLLRTISATSPRFSSMTTRMPDLSDSSRRSEMPSSFFSRTSSPMRDQQVRLVHLVRDLVDDDRLPLALADVLDVRAGADDDAAAAGAVALAHALEAVDDPGGREVGRRHDVDQLVDRRSPGWRAARGTRRRSRSGCAAGCWSPSRRRCPTSR